MTEVLALVIVDFLAGVSSAKITRCAMGMPFSPQSTHVRANFPYLPFWQRAVAQIFITYTRIRDKADLAALDPNARNRALVT